MTVTKENSNDRHQTEELVFDAEVNIDSHNTLRHEMIVQM